MVHLQKLLLQMLCAVTLVAHCSANIYRLNPFFRFLPQRHPVCGWQVPPGEYCGTETNNCCLETTCQFFNVFLREWTSCPDGSDSDSCLCRAPRIDDQIDTYDGSQSDQWVYP